MNTQDVGSVLLHHKIVSRLEDWLQQKAFTHYVYAHKYHSACMWERLWMAIIQGIWERVQIYSGNTMSYGELLEWDYVAVVWYSRHCDIKLTRLFSSWISRSSPAYSLASASFMAPLFAHCCIRYNTSFLKFQLTLVFISETVQIQIK